MAGEKAREVFKDFGYVALMLRRTGPGRPEWMVALGPECSELLAEYFTRRAQVTEAEYRMSGGRFTGLDWPGEALAEFVTAVFEAFGPTKRSV